MIRRWLAALMAAAVLVAGCTGSPEETPPEESPEPTAVPARTEPPSGVPAANDAAGALAKALTAKDVSAVPMQSRAADAQAEFEAIYSGMGDALPTITVGPVVYPMDGENTALATLQHSLEIGHEPWTFETQATFKHVAGEWRLVWEPTVLHPDLTKLSRLRRVVTEPKRAPINDRDGVALVEEVALFQVGIDKANLEQAKWSSSARQLADLLGLDAAAFDNRVRRGGPKQFVIAATLRQAEIPAEVSDVPGLHVKEIAQTVGPSDGFAASILGIVGHPTAEMIEKSNGQLTADDVIGISGLQHRYDKTLGGVGGVRVEVTGRNAESSVQTKVVFNQEESVGRPISISLDRNMQEKAEEILASQQGVASIVAIELETGGVAVAANSPAAGTYPHATYGKYAPGSTFKVVSALAMVRAGATASTIVECTPQHKVGSHTFNNYPGYRHTGSIPLADAIAYSCNTAFTRASETITAEQLKEAAASLGVGTDYDAGFTSNFGTVEPGNNIDRAASMIGQGQVTMSPLGMAAVAASVAKGETVIPWLVKDHEAKSTAKPLTEAEAKELRTMMGETVNKGTLRGVALGAKSGTAQFGAQGQQSTHAWMIAYNDKYAVAAFAEEGSSGGEVALPMIRALLS